MKEFTISVPVLVKDEAELTEEEKNVLEEARQATFRSYSPYSHFSVGAAALLEDGTIVAGSNQENCAYPQGLCAERTTVFYANSRYPGKAIKLLCVVARGTDGEFLSRPIAPCGACRDVIAEKEQIQETPLRVMLFGTDGSYFLESAKMLLPVSFDSSFL